MAPDLRTYYDSYWSPAGFNPRRALPPEVQAVLEPLVGADVDCLDVGCGDGRTEGVWLAQRVASFVGIDVSAQAVQSARDLGLDARLVEDATRLPFEDGSFDLIVSFEVLEHLFAPQEAAREIRRVLRPGGALVVSVPNVGFWQRRAELALGRWNAFGDDESLERPWRDPHIRFFTANALARMLEESGFSDVRVAGHEGGLSTEWSALPELPGLRRLGSRFQRRYKRLERRNPALLSARLHAMCRRPRA
jgi:SAM-dependent methyltransferase